MSVAGTYAIVTKTPMGAQEGVFIIIVDGDTFTGNIDGSMGTMVVYEGKVAGQNLTWKMDMTVPMAMTLECDGTVDGDSISGEVKAGMFGGMPFSGTRK